MTALEKPTEYVNIGRYEQEHTKRNNAHLTVCINLLCINTVCISLNAYLSVCINFQQSLTFYALRWRGLHSFLIYDIYIYIYIVESKIIAINLQIIKLYSVKTFSLQRFVKYFNHIKY